MTFSDHMADWLYGDNGYYSSYRTIGKGGDFYTAVSTSKFFGGTVGKHIIAIIDEGFLPEDSVICEIGAHHGYFLADMIEFIYTLRPELLQTLQFAIVEPFDELQDQQRAYLLDSFGDAVKLTHYRSLDEMEVPNAFFIANEIFDAFPCELYYKGKTARMKGDEIEFDVDDTWVTAKAEKYHKDRGEIAVGYEAFAAQMAKAAKRFEFMSFDYGEMQARPDFSIRVYQEHEVLPLFDEKLDRKEAFGKSDITYDVTFAHVKDAFEETGVIKFIELKAQMTALINMGLLDLLEILQKNVEEKIYKQELEKAKMLIMPDMLGERFKMIRFRK